MRLYMLILISLILAVFLTGTYVFSSNPKNNVNRFFFIFSIISSFTAFAEYACNFSDNPETAVFWLKLQTSVLPVYFTVQLHFLLVFTKTRFLNKINGIFFIYAAAVFITVNSLFSDIFITVTQEWFGYTRLPAAMNTPAGAVFGMFMTFITLLSSIIGILYLKNVSRKPKEKTKAALVLAGLLIPAWFPFIKNGILPLFNISIVFPDTQFIFIGWVCFAIAIWRYDMFEITTKTVADKIVSTMKEALMLVDQDGVIVSVNKAFNGLFEHRGKGITGQSVDDFFKHSADAEEKIGANYKNEEIKNRICLFDTKDKKGAHINFSVSFLKNRKQDIVGYVFIMGDISEMAEAQNQLQKQHEDLIEIARQAGMAEMATNTMHNIGNILNSVNISSEHFISTLEKMKVSEFKKASDLLHANSDSLHEFFTDEEKGKYLPEYISHIIDQLQKQNNTLKTESKRLIEKISIIENNIAIQQERTKRNSTDKNKTDI